MKRTFLYAALYLTFVVNATSQSLSDPDRKLTLEHLQKTKKELLSSLKGLSDEQMNYKPDADTWSVAECLEHLAISEQNLFGIVQMTLQNEPDPRQREALVMDDDQLLGMITDRDNKVKTRPDFEPSNQFGSVSATLAAFKERRASNAVFVKTTEEDLRNRYFDFPFGKVDAVQVLLFLAGHTQRHTDQIKELIASREFPG